MNPTRPKYTLDLTAADRELSCLAMRVTARAVREGRCDAAHVKCAPSDAVTVGSMLTFRGAAYGVSNDGSATLAAQSCRPPNFLMPQCGFRIAAIHALRSI